MYRLSLIGFTGKPGQQKLTKSGSLVPLRSVATKESWKNKDTGDWEPDRMARIVGWSRLAEFATSLKSSAHIQVEGRTPQPGLPERRRHPSRLGMQSLPTASRIAKLDRIDRDEDSSSFDESGDNKPPL
jgi:single-strand DNA-binding protein